MLFDLFPEKTLNTISGVIQLVI